MGVGEAAQRRPGHAGVLAGVVGEFADALGAGTEGEFGDKGLLIGRQRAQANREIGGQAVPDHADRAGEVVEHGDVDPVCDNGHARTESPRRWRSADPRQAGGDSTNKASRVSLRACAAARSASVLVGERAQALGGEIAEPRLVAGRHVAKTLGVVAITETGRRTPPSP